MTFEQLDLTGTYSYADYLKWTFKERLELIKGKVFNMSPAPARTHQLISMRISTRIFNYLEGKSCQVYAAPFDVRLTPLRNKAKKNQIYTVVQPDICVICDPSKLDKHGCIGSPELVIEILSPSNSRREMKEKFEVYEENQVLEYWLVEPNQEAVFVYVLNENGKYIGLKPFTMDDKITSTVLADFSIEVSDIFNY